METIRTIFYVAVMLITFIFAFGLLIQTHKELKKEMGSEVIDWFKTTTLGMWHFNRKNNVKILSDREYLKYVTNGKIKDEIVIDNPLK